MIRLDVRRAEGRVLAILAPVASFALRWWPVFAVTIVYLVILLAAPSQISSILQAGRTDGRWTDWLTFVAPAILAGVGHVALSPATAGGRDRWGSLFAVAPLVAMTLITARWAPWTLLFMIPSACAAAALCYGLHPVIARTPQVWRRAAVAATLILFAACIAGLQLSPQVLPKAIGPLGILSLGLALVGLLLAIASLRPVLAGLYLVLCVASALTWRDARPVELYDESRYVYGHSLASGLDVWLRSRGDLDDYRRAGRPYPVIIASAEGGGIYAAAHAYTALAAMSDVCPSFGQHLFATVGVSGGSIGTLLYAARSPSKVRNGPLRPCGRGPADVDTDVLTTDLLSPALANLMFLRTADFLIPGPDLFEDGGQTLTESIADMDRGNPRMIAPLRAGWDPRGVAPMTIFVSTDVASGNRFVFSPAASSGAENAETFPGGSVVSHHDIAANTAAFISARFPWLTPTARLRVSEHSYRILADGGYFENSGAETAMDLIRQIRQLAEPVGCDGALAGEDEGTGPCECPLRVVSMFEEAVVWHGCSIPVFIAYMPIAEGVGMPGLAFEDTPHPGQSWLADPLSAMMQTRGARGVLALDRARSAFAGPEDPTLAQGTSVDVGFFPHGIGVSELALPLGWKLSKRSAADILAYGAPIADCDGQGEPAPPFRSPAGGETTDGGDVDAIGRENSCQMRMLAWLFRAPAGPDGVAIRWFGGG